MEVLGSWQNWSESTNSSWLPIILSFLGSHCIHHKMFSNIPDLCPPDTINISWLWKVQMSLLCVCVCVCVCVCSQSCATPWTLVCQAPLSLGFSSQEYWSGLPFPSPGDPRLPMLLDIAKVSLWTNSSLVESYYLRILYPLQKKIKARFCLLVS